jgi:hypothetical protein
MARINLTPRKLKSLPPAPEGKRYELMDAEAPGLGVRVAIRASVARRRAGGTGRSAPVPAIHTPDAPRRPDGLGKSGFGCRPLSGLFEKENSRLDSSDGAFHL